MLPRAIANRFLHLRPRERPAAPGKILVAHDLLLGDTLMLTPLLAKLRERHPQARIAMTVRRDVALLYAGRPYGVELVVFDPRDASTLDALFAYGGFDLAYVPGDNRHSWLAAAAGARWIVAHAGGRPAYKSWPADELRPYPGTPAAWADMVAALAEGPAPHAYRAQDWPVPPFAPFNLPSGKYCVLHLGASTPLKYWPADRWANLAARLSQQGYGVAWSAGPAEARLVDEADPAGRFASYAGRLDLAQLWHLVAKADLLVTVDTGVAHLAKLTGTPTICLYGPGSAVLVGKGEFWKDASFREMTQADFPCRDQRVLFKREIAWVRRCQRTLRECPAPRCMHAIDADDVARAALDCARNAG
ncbi:MAG: glycosyltransferase family 9 protein [Burkholderiales bacterium]